MAITIGQIIIWIIVGALAGSLTGMVMTRSRAGYGRWTNLGIGLAGALIGGFLFNLLGIDFALGELAITFEDLIAAVAGSLILLGIIALVRRFRNQASGTQ
ncbi:GlsB/YeaQ/YmgE family stress response membrane protein [Chloroflexi bacterium TSY]|nr:GlsB/YeaQ/YmgE family stress response membrane protein [Chloroflexi bacterium TSY]